MGENIYWEAVCGNNGTKDAFWAPNITWNTYSPAFTVCFEHTVLVWIPVAYLIIVSPFFLWYLSRRNTVHSWRKLGALTVIRLLIQAIACVSLLAYIVRKIIAISDGSDKISYVFAAPCIVLVELLFVGFLMYYEHIKGIVSSGCVFIWWLLVTLCAIGPFVGNIVRATKGLPPDLFQFITFYMAYAIILLQFILQFIADRAAYKEDTYRTFPKRGKKAKYQHINLNKLPEDPEILGKPCPNLTSSFPSKLTFSWMFPLMVTGFRRTLTFDDLWDLLPQHRTKTIVNAFRMEWFRQLKRLCSKREKSSGMELKRKLPDACPCEDDNDETSKANAMQNPGFVDKSIRPTLFTVYTRALGKEFAVAGIFMGLYVAAQLVQPQIMNLLINYVSSDNPYVWHGILYATLLCVMVLFQAVMIQQHNEITFNVGMKLRTAVIGAIYRKTMRLSAAGRMGATAGEIQNLMAVDSMKLMMVPNFLHMIWSGPVTIILALILIWQFLQLATLAGMAFLLLLLVANIMIGSYARKYQIAQMREKDNRLKMMNEILNGMKVLKLYAWEQCYADIINVSRCKELTQLKKAAYARAASSVMISLVPYITSLASFGVFIAISTENVLTPNVAFVSLTYFNMMNISLITLPMIIQNVVQANVSTKRIENYLNMEEIDPNSVSKHPDSVNAISIKNGTFAWGEDEQPVLNGINLDIKKGSLVAVVGSVGTGKSSLISAILGEMVVKNGTVNVDGEIAYAAQQAWIQSGTVQTNILFGKEIKHAKYRATIEACALKSDLDNLPGGDQCEIGNKGLNLSGGQKQRLALARAVYQNSDVYVMDDVLSAVDAHVGKHIFDQVIGRDGIIGHKTRIFITHGVSNLPNCDHIVVIRDGEINEQGGFDELISRNGGFAEYIRQYLSDLDDEEELEQVLDASGDLIEKISVLSGDDSQSFTNELKKKAKERMLKRQQSEMEVCLLEPEKEAIELKEITEKEVGDTDIHLEEQDKKKLTSKEQTQEGSVKMEVYGAYVKACGLHWSIPTICGYLLFTAGTVGSNVWLGYWSSDKPGATTEETLAQVYLRLGVYGGIGAFMAICILVQTISFANATTNASRVVHIDLLNALMHAPMSFFDTTPQGRIVNRVSKDVDTIDVNIPMSMSQWMMTFGKVLSILIIICISTPIFLAALVVLGILYYLLQRFYINSSRQLKRIDAVMRSPIFEHFGETVSGTSTIRAYKQTVRFIDISDRLVDRNNMAYYPMIMTARWLGIYLSSISGILVLCAAVFGIASRGSIDAGILGLSISYAIQITGVLNVMVLASSDIEANIVSNERIQEFTEIEPEADWQIPNTCPGKDWPEHGKLELTNYSVRYREGLDLVLRGIDCVIKPGQKVGIVGRTGAGKSSLTLALFRMIEAATGDIIIDGKKISELGLHDLRSKLTIIPQEPVIFSGTLRANLDPHNELADEQLWRVLEMANLKTFIESQNNGLNFQCSEGGENMSVGQRQLVCLARALLKKTNILILDEATAAVDLKTDDLIQYLIRTEFSNCTTITIAHRLQTIMDYDRIMVLDKGLIKEYDSPSNLLRDEDSVFYSMAKDAGLA